MYSGILPKCTLVYDLDVCKVYNLNALWYIT